jgi:AraC-like DNA-binding protein
VEHARRLLLDPLNNVSSVSDACGFSTPAYFARVFRKVVGCSPAEYANDPRRSKAPAGMPRVCSAAAGSAAQQLP